MDDKNGIGSAVGDQMKIAVIGAGAAGVFAAIVAANSSRSAEIEILEASHKPLAKVLISGGGRCNLTNHCFDPAELVKNYPRGSRELLSAFSRFQPRDTVEWFERRGVRLKVEEEGRVFPSTDNSETIVDCLLDEANKYGIKIRTGARVKGIRLIKGGANSNGFNIALENGANNRHDRVLLATGGSSLGHKIAEAMNHTIIPCVPSLFTLKINDERIKGLAGVSFGNAQLSLVEKAKRKIAQSGGLLITHWGLTGPAVLKLSAWGARVLHDSDYNAEIEINFLPNRTSDELYRMLIEYKSRNSRKRISSAEVLLIPNRYWSRITQVMGIENELTWAEITAKMMRGIISELTHGQFRISGKATYKEEFVTCGGVDLKEVDFRTMESKICPGLYFAGEILDIDGITGGFNLQNAWTTGWIAGTSMVK